jgi:hypothetical protein
VLTREDLTGFMKNVWNIWGFILRLYDMNTSERWLLTAGLALALIDVCMLLQPLHAAGGGAFGG